MVDRFKCGVAPAIGGRDVRASVDYGITFGDGIKQKLWYWLSAVAFFLPGVAARGGFDGGQGAAVIEKAAGELHSGLIMMTIYSHCWWPDK